MDRQERGRRGEAAAAKYYLDRGCRLLAHGYRTRQGELDLILEDRGVIVVAEVKTRGQRALFSGLRRWIRQSKAPHLLAAKRYFAAKQRPHRTPGAVRCGGSGLCAGRVSGPLYQKRIRGRAVRAAPAGLAEEGKGGNNMQFAAQGMRGACRRSAGDHTGAFQRTAGCSCPHRFRQRTWKRCCQAGGIPP